MMINALSNLLLIVWAAALPFFTGWLIANHGGLPAINRFFKVHIEPWMKSSADS